MAEAENTAGSRGSPSDTLRPRKLLLRFSGDVTTKAPATRRRFLKRLRDNVKDALRAAGVERPRLDPTHSRLFVELADDPGSRGAGNLSRVFGLQSLSSVEERSWRDLDDLVACGVELFAERVRGRSFGVRARRVGDRRGIPVRSDEVQRALGAALVPHAREVRLDDPEVQVSLEIMSDRVYFFTESVAGPGGLPLGCEGRAVSLVSGGFDSPVAAWQVMRRGVALDHVFCCLGGRAHQLETLQVMKVIADDWSYGTRPHLHAVDFEEVTREIQASVTPRFWQIVLKRMMVRAADAVASEREASAIVTGEALGQVSSQTLPNLAVISAVTALPILRPLIGCNKDEIIALSRRIGTHDLSAKVAEYCAIVPRKPATRASLAQIEDEESGIDPRVLERAVAERSLFDLRELDLENLERPELQIDEIPDGATVIDLRSKAAYQGWHWPDALYLDFHHALHAHPHFDRSQRYVLYCEFGLKSGHLAEKMREKGLQAWHFAGGLKALIAHARERGIPTPDV